MLNLSASAREVLKTAALLDKFHLLSSARQQQLGEEMRRRHEAAASSETTARARVSQINRALQANHRRNSALERELLHTAGDLEKIKNEVERKQKQLHDLVNHLQRNRLWLRGKKEQIAAADESLKSTRSLICEHQGQVAVQEQQRKAYLVTLHTLETELSKATRRLKQIDSARSDASHQLKVAAQNSREKQQTLNNLQQKLQRKEDLAKLQTVNADAQRQAVEVELRKLKDSISDATCRIRTAQSRKEEALQRLAQRQQVLRVEQQDLKELLAEEAKVVAEISEIALASDAAALGAVAAAREKENARKNRFDGNICQQKAPQKLQQGHQLERQEEKSDKFAVSTTTAKKRTRKRRRVRRDKNTASTLVSASLVRRIRLNSERVNSDLF